MQKQKLLIPSRPLQLLPELAVRIGLNEAIVVQQVHYWLRNSGREREGRIWIYKTYPEWHEQDFPFWSNSTIGRIFRGLEDDLILISKQFDASEWSHKKYYSIRYENDLFDDTYYGTFERVKLTSSKTSDRNDLHSTENTTENTTEKEDNFGEIYQDLLDLWGELFPEKPQPRPGTKSYRDKFRTRLKNDHFRDNWESALRAAAESPTLHKESWFDLRFFLRNDDNYQKCLDRWMEWKDKQLKGGRSNKLADTSKVRSNRMTKYRWRQLSSGQQKNILKRYGVDSVDQLNLPE